jgi:Mrp family chromosome partitioning ATPase
MGKMFDAFHQARGKRQPSSPPDAPALTTVWPDEDTVAPEAEEEMPFIEVGGPHEPGEKVLPVMPPPMILKPTPAITPEISVISRPSAVKDTGGFMTVRFRAVPVEGVSTSSRSRFAPELIAFHQPDHAISAQYRDLTTCLLAQTPQQQPRVLLFAGSCAGAGTTTVVLNTAITLARQNLRRVVVLDAHLKRSAVAARLGLQETPGLRDVLAGRMTLEESICSTSLPGLMVLTAGAPDAIPSIRLAGEAMRSLLRQVRDQHDLVLVDAACWDGRPEVVALGCACDAVYLCVPEKHQESTEARELMQIVTEQGATLRGCILTSR